MREREGERVCRFLEEGSECMRERVLFPSGERVRFQVERVCERG
jgi:hypothetical protein